MAQVSRRFLDKKVQEKISSLFTTSIVLTQTKESAISLIEDLLTPTEKIVLSKRFSIAFMLLENYDYELIKDTLKVSSTTIGTIANWLKIKGGSIRNLHEKIKQNESLENIWEEVKESMFETLTSAPGFNWRESKRALHQMRKERRKPF